MKHPVKRALSLFLSFAILFQSMIYFPAKAANSAEGSGTVALGSSAIAYSQKLIDNGDSTYTLTLTLKDASYISDLNSDFTVSRNHCFIAPADGDYLVELWGGDGANGGDSGEDSTGGKGGYVYGVVTLKKGDVLFYQLGGDGQSTITEGEGGGAQEEHGEAAERHDKDDVRIQEEAQRAHQNARQVNKIAENSVEQNYGDGEDQKQWVNGKKLPRGDGKTDTVQGEKCGGKALTVQEKVAVMRTRLNDVLRGCRDLTARQKRGGGCHVRKVELVVP
jgi:hypothetical protein